MFLRQLGLGGNANRVFFTFVRPSNIINTQAHFFSTFGSKSPFNVVNSQSTHLKNFNLIQTNPNSSTPINKLYFLNSLRNYSQKLSQEERVKIYKQNWQKRQEEAAEKNSRVGKYAIIVIILVVGLSYAAVPLYQIFCSATGYGGTVKVAEDKRVSSLIDKEVRSNRPLRIKFAAQASSSIPWKFFPLQNEITCVPGESVLAFYNAKNKSQEPVVGLSIYNVIPAKASIYFNKVQCFCFEEQRLEAGEDVDMPVLFYIDPEFADDPTMADVNEIILSYTFFRVNNDNLDPELITAIESAPPQPSVEALKHNKPVSAVQPPCYIYCSRSSNPQRKLNFEMDDYKQKNKLYFTIAGDVAVGKSALVLRYTSISQVFIEEYDPTIEDCHTKSVQVNDNIYVCDFIDSAGQEEYAHMRDMYIKKSHGFILVFSVISSKSVDFVKSYLANIKAACTDPIFVLVGNKNDLVDERVVTLETAQSLAAEWDCPYFDSSAKDGTNVDVVFQKVVEMAVEKERKNWNQTQLEAEKKKKCTLL